MYKIQVMLISLFISSQAFSFWRVFDCQETRNSQKIRISAEVTQQNRRGLSNGELDLRIQKDGETIINNRSFVSLRRGAGLYELDYWGRARLVIDTWPDNPRSIRFGRYYDAKLRLSNFNNGRWFNKLECQYVGF